ncbi:hypothetical protein Tco_0295686 [Tanacetum coccineum]
MAAEVPRTLEYRGAGQRKAKGQWTTDKRKAANLDHRLKSLIIYKALMNEFVNDGIKLSKLKINIGFINGLPKKWKDFQDSPDKKEDTRSSQEYMDNFKEEYQARALLAKSKRFFKKGTQRFSGAKATDKMNVLKC